MTISRRSAVAGILIAGGVLVPTVAVGRDPLRGLDLDGDGTVDLEEANKAASALFDRLDTDHEGTLDARELRGRLSAKDLAAGDPDKDKTLTKDEYLAIVARRFKAADTDNDGTLDARELRSPAGRALLKLLK